MLGNLSDFDPNKDYIGFSMRGKLNRVITLKAIDLTNDVLDAYESYDFEKIFRLIMPFVINDISAFYLDYTKDILYILDEDNFERRSVQSTIYDVLMRLLKLLTPIIPHTTSEAYQYLPFRDYEDVYLESMPKKQANEFKNYIEDFEKFEILRNEVLKQIEVARNEKLLSKTLEADLDVTVTKEILDAINELEIDLIQVLMVADIKVKVGSEVEVKVSKSSNVTCSRCWNVVPLINEDELCPRCASIIEKRST